MARSHRRITLRGRNLTRREISAEGFGTQRGHPHMNRRPSSKLPLSGDFLERMMGLAPTTFCMANANDRSRPFASVRSNHLFPGLSVQASERERTLKLAILATESTAFLDELRELGRKLPDLRLILTMAQDPGWNEARRKSGDLAVDGSRAQARARSRPGCMAGTRGRPGSGAQQGFRIRRPLALPR